MDDWSKTTPGPWLHEHGELFGDEDPSGEMGARKIGDVNRDDAPLIVEMRNMLADLGAARRSGVSGRSAAVLRNICDLADELARGKGE